MGDDSIERLYAAGYLDRLEERPIEEVRAMRAECQDVETGLSYLRRVVQGRLDIVAAEVERRRSGAEPGDVASLIEALPEILGDHLRAPGAGRLPVSFGQGRVDPELEAEIEAAVEDFDDLASIDDAELAAGRERLAALEHKISTRRRSLFDRIDALQAEITRRYRTGEASVESLLS